MFAAASSRRVLHITSRIIIEGFDSWGCVECIRSEHAENVEGVAFLFHVIFSLLYKAPRGPRARAAFCMVL